MQPKSAVQTLVYYNTFRCTPALAEDGTQQVFGFKFHLNSPWLFGPNWNALATNGAQELTPNDPIQPLEVAGHPFENTTIIPGMRNQGGDPYSKYANGVITGSKTTFSASPITSSGVDQLQLGYLVTRKHSNVNDIPSTADITEIKKYPFIQMRKLMAGSNVTNNGTHIEARCTVTHSPKRFNNIKDYRDNPQLSFKTNSSVVDAVGVIPAEKDVLSVYVVPALNDYVPSGQTARAKATDFMLVMKHEVHILWTEPTTDVSNPQNFEMYSPARGFSGFAHGVSRMIGRY